MTDQPARVDPGARRRVYACLASIALVVVGLPWLMAPISRLVARPAPQVGAGAGERAPASDPAAQPPVPVPRQALAAGRGPGQSGALAAESPDALGNDELFGSDDAPVPSPPPVDDASDIGERERITRHGPTASAGPTSVDQAGQLAPTAEPGSLVRAALGSLLVGLLTACVATLIGGLLGLASGYRGGLVERIAVRWFADGLDALPQFVVLVTAVALYRDLAGTEGDALLVAVGVLVGVVNSTQVLLVVHHQTRLVAARKYVIAARLMGWPALRVVRRKIVPHLRHELIIPFTQLVIWGVFVETALSYLGFGPSSTGSTLGARLHRIDPFAHSEDLAPALLMCLMTVALAAALRATGDAVDALYAGPAGEEAA